MHSDLGVLIDELKLIKDNDNDFKFTHGDIRSFLRTFISAVEEGIIQPFSGMEFDDRDKILFFLNLIRVYGIPHYDRSRMAARCLTLIETAEAKKKMSVATQNDDNDWDSIPF